MSIALKRNVTFCVTNGRTVFLDLSADRYFCLPEPLEDPFQQLLQKNRRDGTSDDSGPDFMATGLFDPDDSKRGPLTPTRHCTPTESLLEQAVRSSNAEDVAMATVSQLLTTLKLRLRSLPKTINRLQQRKAKAHPLAQDRPNSQVAKLACAFLVTRRLIPNQNRCLQRSIALVDFLAIHGIYPDLVIGVRMQPFAAHAWVQVGETVMNDYLDEVLVHTPILVV